MTAQNSVDKQYLDLIKDVLSNGVVKHDRTGVGTKAVFGRSMRFDLSKGFPMLTTKKVHWKSVVLELIWFLRGETNVKWLQERGVTIWDEWADENGELGPVYGKQWRDWVAPDGRHIDQIQNLIRDIKTSPDSRRLIVSAWNVADVSTMALPPCHAFFQCFVANGKLSLKLTQRSMDCALGCPFNIASYALLVHILADLTDLEVGEFIHDIGDTHVYLNHMDGLAVQLEREPRDLPRVRLAKKFKTLEELENASLEDFILEGYDPHPGIKFDVAK